jgi:hypothetical protein
MAIIVPAQRTWSNPRPACHLQTHEGRPGSLAKSALDTTKNSTLRTIPQSAQNGTALSVSHGLDGRDPAASVAVISNLAGCSLPVRRLVSADIVGGSDQDCFFFCVFCVLCGLFLSVCSVGSAPRSRRLEAADANQILLFSPQITQITQRAFWMAHGARTWAMAVGWHRPTRCLRSGGFQPAGPRPSRPQTRSRRHPSADPASIVFFLLRDLCVLWAFSLGVLCGPSLLAADLRRLAVTSQSPESP